jgi:hypothetical protein
MPPGGLAAGEVTAGQEPLGNLRLGGGGTGPTAAVVLDGELDTLRLLVARYPVRQARAMSMPAETPAPVTYLPSNT